MRASTVMRPMALSQCEAYGPAIPVTIACASGELKNSATSGNASSTKPLSRRKYPHATVNECQASAETRTHTDLTPDADEGIDGGEDDGSDDDDGDGVGQDADTGAPPSEIAAFDEPLSVAHSLGRWAASV